MGKTKGIVFLLLLILAAGITSANGISVIGTNSFSVNKISSDIQSINFQLQNQETFTFYNISFESNPYVSINQFDLPSGQMINVTALVNGARNFNGQLRIKGFYQSNLGQNFINYPLDVYFDQNLSKCDFSIIKGDKITWNNFVNDPITIRNSITGNDVATIQQNSSGQLSFDTPETFSYYILRQGFIIPSTPCTVTVLDTTGIINNPDLDGNITLNLTIISLPTNISANILTSSYTMNFFDNFQDIMSVKNTGNNTAKNIILNGDWFSFSQNNFDLQPGASINVGYTISPIISTTNETNMTYSKNITISGNFPTLNPSFSIFINYADINENSTGGTGIVAFITKFCAANPQICNTQPKIIYRSNNSDNVSITMTQDQWNKWITDWFNWKDGQKKQNAIVTEQISSVGNNVSTIRDDNNQTQTKMNDLITQVSGMGSSTVFNVLTFSSIFICMLLGGIIIMKKRGNRMKSVSNYR